MFLVLFFFDLSIYFSEQHPLVFPLKGKVNMIVSMRQSLHLASSNKLVTKNISDEDFQLF